MSVQNVELNNDYLKKLDGFTAIDIDEVVDYVPQAYRELPKNQQAIFQIKPLDGGDIFDLISQNDIEVSDDNLVSQSDLMVMSPTICRLGIVGWKNFRTLKGKELKYNKLCKGLSVPLITELAVAIFGLNAINSEEELGLK